MATNKELLEKAITTSVVGAGSGGILTAKQSNKFIDYLVEQSVLIKDSRVVRMSQPSQDIDKVAVGTRIMRKATEAVDDGVNASATFTKISMTTVKLRLDYELSTESLEDNIEGRSLEDHVVSLMTRQAANDVEDLAIHGVTTSTDPLLKSLNGWRYLMRNGANAAHVVDAAGANLTRATFDQALRSLPNKYLQRRSQLKFTTSSSLIQDYLVSLTNANAATGAASPGSTWGDGTITGGPGAEGGANLGNLNGLSPFGIPLKEVPLYEETETGTYSAATGNHGVLELTFPENRIFGIQREIQSFREFKIRKDTTEFTMYTRIAVNIENGDAAVHVKNLRVRAV